MVQANTTVTTQNWETVPQDTQETQNTVQQDAADSTDELLNEWNLDAERE